MATPTMTLDNNFKLALAEGITNAMEHGNKWDSAKLVRVESEATRDTLKVSISDEGPGFDYAALPDSKLDERLFNERGRGVFLMRAIMDEVSYNPEDNCLILS